MPHPIRYYEPYHRPLVEQFIEQAAKDLGFEKVERLVSTVHSLVSYRFHRNGDYWDFYPQVTTSLDWTRPLLTFLRKVAHDQDKDPTRVLQEAHGL